MGVSMGVHMPALAGQVALGQDGRVVARRRQALRRRATSWLATSCPPCRATCEGSGRRSERRDGRRAGASGLRSPVARPSPCRSPPTALAVV